MRPLDRSIFFFIVCLAAILTALAYGIAVSVKTDEQVTKSTYDAWRKYSGKELTYEEWRLLY